MPDAYDEKVLRATTTFLARWQKTSLRLLPHGPSLRHFLIVLSRPETPPSQNLVLFVDPLWWHGLFEWDDAELSVELVNAASTPAAGRASIARLFRITDASRDFECLTESLEVKENVRL